MKDSNKTSRISMQQYLEDLRDALNSNRRKHGLPETVTIADSSDTETYRVTFRPLARRFRKEKQKKELQK